MPRIVRSHRTMCQTDANAHFPRDTLTKPADRKEVERKGEERFFFRRSGLHAGGQQAE